MEMTTTTFAALAEPTRLSIIDLLVRHGELAATDISDQFTSSPSAISQHLKVLLAARLVSMRKQAQKRLYRLEPSSLAAAESWLADRNAMWSSRLDAMEACVASQPKEDVNE